MKVILNSDILYYGGKLMRQRVSRTLGDLCLACAEQGHIIVIPQTALLEFNKQQKDALRAEIGRLESAYSTLELANIPFDRKEPEDVLELPNLLHLLQEYGVRVIVEEPTLEDFHEAHRRASFHEPPCIPGAKSDEMRDVIIWLIAIRLASEDGVALLISRDKVHAGPQGEEEASRVGLLREQSIDDALDQFDYYGLQTPAGEQIHELLNLLAGDLQDADLPLTSPVTLRGLSHIEFRRNLAGATEIRFHLNAESPEGEGLTARGEIDVKSLKVTRVNLTDIRLNGQQWQEGSVTITEERLIPPTDVFRNLVSEDTEFRARQLRQILSHSV